MNRQWMMIEKTELEYHYHLQEEAKKRFFIQREEGKGEKCATIKNIVMKSSATTATLSSGQISRAHELEKTTTSHRQRSQARCTFYRP